MDEVRAKLSIYTKLLLSTVLLTSAFSIKADDQQLIKSLQGLLPDANITQVNPSPVKGIYEVMIGTDVIYVTGDGQFIFKGDLIDIGKRHNLSETLRAQSRASLLKQIPKNDYIEFPSKQGNDVIYAFTDVDCGYCRKLHADVAELNDNAVTVRYLAYPRGGIQSATYRTMVNIWCAEDRPEALTSAKKGLSVKANSCKNPVEKQYALGGQMGVRGTPAIFLENGFALPGYVPPDSILKSLGR